MKALIVILSIVALLAISMLTVTISAYVKELNLFNSGWIGPKYFSFNLESSDSTKKLAPGESAEYRFTVSNNDSSGVSQVPLHVSIEIDYPAQLAGTGSILAELYLDGSVLASDTGSGFLAVMGATLPGGEATTDTYTLKLTWLDTDLKALGVMVDEDFEPSDINIRVSGYQ